MAKDDTHRVTRLLGELRAGRKEVEDELAELVYDDLRQVAERRLGGRGSATLEPAALVNECWMRLVQQRSGFENRTQFFAVASRLMLRALLDHERRRAALRRGGGMERVTLGFEIPAAEKETGVEVALLEEALERLDKSVPRKADVARLRGLAGLSIAETADELGVSAATVERDWAFARAWLSREVVRLQEGSPDAGEAPDEFSPEL